MGKQCWFLYIDPHYISLAWLQRETDYPIYYISLMAATSNICG